MSGNGLKESSHFFLQSWIWEKGSIHGLGQISVPITSFSIALLEKGLFFRLERNHLLLRLNQTNLLELFVVS